MSATIGQPNEEADFKALSFVRKSMIRKNNLIRALRKQLEDTQYEFEALKRKCNDQQSKLDSYAVNDHYSTGYNTQAYSITEDVAGIQSEHTRANALQVGEGILDDGVQPTSIKTEYLPGEESHSSSDNPLNTPFSQTTQFHPLERPEWGEPQHMEQSYVDQHTETGQQNDYTENGNCTSYGESIMRLEKHQRRGSDVDEHQGEGQGTPGGRTLQVKATLKRHECSVCGRAFLSKTHLDDHLLTHTGEKPLHCPAAGCVFRCRNTSSMKRHMHTHTVDKPFACPVEGCGYRAARRSAFKEHMSSHTGEKPFPCPVEGCGYRAARRDNLKIHMRFHTGEKPFPCPVEGCGYRAAQSSTVKIHMRSHTGEKPFACPVEGCGYRAVRRCTVKVHMRSHTGEKPFACPVEGCEYRTAHRGYVKTHMSTHTGNISFA